MSNICIIQARNGSSRLPGKVMMNVGEKSILENVVSRISKSRYLDKIIIAITENSEDDTLAELCNKNNYACFRGSDWDVLDRFYKCALQHTANSDDNIIRICCDNPLHSFKVVDFAIEQFIKLDLDYFSNSNHEPKYLEDGFDVEITKFSVLEKAWNNASLLSEREHVMPYIKNSGKFRIGWRKYHPRYQYKLSVDTQNDLEAVSAIYDELKAIVDFGIDEVVDLLEQKPGLLEINKDSVINSGYARSISDDRQVKE